MLDEEAGMVGLVAARGHASWEEGFRPRVLLLHENSTELACWVEALRSTCHIARGQDIAALEEALATGAIDVIVVSKWGEELMTLLQRSRRTIRVIHCGPVLPESVVDAVGNGFEV